MKNTVNTLLKQKQDGDKITMLTCYDYSTAKLMEEVGVNTILVGDSLGNTMLGYEDTIQVTMEDMIHHCAAVSRGIKDILFSLRYAIYVISDISLRCSCKRRQTYEGRSR